MLIPTVTKIEGDMMTIKLGEEPKQPDEIVTDLYAITKEKIRKGSLITIDDTNYKVQSCRKHKEDYKLTILKK